MFEGILVSDDYLCEIKTGRLDLKEVLIYLKEEMTKICNMEKYLEILKVYSIVDTINKNFNELKKEKEVEVIVELRKWNEPKFKNFMDNNVKEFLEENITNILSTTDGVIKAMSIKLICNINHIRQECIEKLVNEFVSDSQWYFIQYRKEFSKVIKNKELKEDFIENLFLPVKFDDIFKIEYKLDIIDNYKSITELKERFEIELVKILKSDQFDEVHVYSKMTIIKKILKNTKVTIKSRILIEEIERKLEPIFNEKLRKEGQSYSIEVKLDRYLRDVENLSELKEKMLFIHAIGIEQDNFYSIYEVIPKIKLGMIDLITSTDSKYSRGIIYAMDMNKMEMALILQYLIYENNNNFWETLKDIYNEVLKVLEILEEKDEKNIFVDNFKRMYENNLYEDCASRLIREIEYLLRAVHIEVEYGVNFSGSNYINIGLNTILQEGNLGGIFSKNEILCLRYILIDEDGFNYRNGIAHKNGKKITQMDVEYLLSVLILILKFIDYKGLKK